MIDDLAVHGGQDFVASIDEINLGPGHGEHARVLATDDAAAQNDHGFGHRFEIENVVAVKNGLAVDRKMRRRDRTRTYRDEDEWRSELLAPLVRGDLHVARRYHSGPS